MDGPVVASLISSSVAVLVAVGSAIRADLLRASDRRYERRRMFLIDAQDAALALRDALREYGEALELTSELGRRGRRDAELRVAVSAASGRFDVARSRVEDAAVVTLLEHWEAVAREALIGLEPEVPGDDAAFAELNGAVSRALRSTTGRGRR